jgi:hypothetical protein
MFYIEELKDILLTAWKNFRISCVVACLCISPGAFDKDSLGFGIIFLQLCNINY